MVSMHDGANVPLVKNGCDRNPGGSKEGLFQKCLNKAPVL
jgi:hypothetical protein